MSYGATLPEVVDFEDVSSAVGQRGVEDQRGLADTTARPRGQVLQFETSGVAHPREALGHQLRRGKWARNPDAWTTAIYFESEWGVNQDHTSQWKRQHAELLRIETTTGAIPIGLSPPLDPADDFPEIVVRQANQVAPKPAGNLKGKKLKGVPRFKPNKDEIENLLEES